MATDPHWSLPGGVALVTGAAGGIGAALALNLARRGMALALVDRDAAGLQAVADQAAAVGVAVSRHVIDLAERAQVDGVLPAVLAAHGRLTLLVNNAGVALGGRFEQVDEADFDWLMRINFDAPVRLTRACLPVLARAPAALVVNVSSIFGIVAPPGQTAYCASKFALRGFSESLRHELAMAGSPVRLMLVHPGGVRTGIADNARVAVTATADEVASEQAAWRVLLRLSPEQAAEQIARGIVRRAPRVLVGRDAAQAAWLQRLMPVGYWAVMARDLARRTGRAA
ncbi:MAG: acetoin dehydrogenase [Burkholderiales bacterium RIFCSPHIGHO2_12_FULL_69_20]|nr:MAG: acetoin dehydrogenase [Burkholderiales bacterium RIFCSPHIGHO2_12_FULL_69_20]